MSTDNPSHDHELICPITFELFRDPVLANDGHVYERAAITQWIQQHGTSPFTRQILHVEDLCNDEYIKKLANQRRTSTVSITKDIGIVKFLSNLRLSRKRHNASVHPSGSLIIERTITRRSDSEKRLWLVICLMIISMGGILSITLLLSMPITTASGNTFNSCISSTAQVTTLLSLTNATQFNYTHFSYLYKAIASNDTLVFSFQLNSSYWCLDDLSMVNIYSKARLIQNGGFKNGVLKPFRFCSDCNPIPPDLSPTTTEERSGEYAFCYRPTSNVSYLIQTVNTTKGQIYNISFWLANLSEPINKLKVFVIV